ncbi:MAG TPA: 8-amino-7-oxononanoate synthase [Verrucomicrobiae bacterium]|nr:8-amino-7-oxononanoate synthase [Verrucomicrobiae bacterium]
MNDFNVELEHRLNLLREQNLLRELRRVDSPQSPHIKIGGKTFLNFSSNDYLGLANDPILKDAALRAIKQFGSGSGASRLLCGSLAPFHELEEALAQFKKTQAALTFSSGYATALGAIGALPGKNDVIILDKLVHACIVDAAKLSGAKIRVFAHNDLTDLKEKLFWAQKFKSAVLIVTESIFSMDGDSAPLREMVELKNKFGAWLMVDEAHATGIFGKNGRGLADELGVSDQIEVQMGTLGKALGSSGGYICGSRALIDFLVNRARSLIFSTAPIPAAAAAATAAIRFVQSREGEARRKFLRERINGLNRKLKIQNSKFQGAIIPIIIGAEIKAIQAADKLREQNIFVPAIRFPSVARGAARLRLTVSAAHSADDISQLIRALKTLDIALPTLAA